MPLFEILAHAVLGVFTGPKRLEGTGNVRVVSTGAPQSIVGDQVSDKVRLSRDSATVNIEFSGFLSNALEDGVIVGRALVADDPDQDKDVPDASGFATIRLNNVRFAGQPPRVGTLLLEQRIHATGFINSPEGIRTSIHYSVTGGEGGFRGAKGTGVGRAFVSRDPNNPFSEASYWLELTV